MFPAFAKTSGGWILSSSAAATGSFKAASGSLIGRLRHGILDALEVGHLRRPAGAGWHERLSVDPLSI
jgi:hypothetical protein